MRIEPMTRNDFGLGAQLLFLLYHSAKFIGVITFCFRFPVRKVRLRYFAEMIPLQQKFISSKALFSMKLLSRLISRITNPSLQATE